MDKTLDLRPQQPVGSRLAPRCLRHTARKHKQVDKMATTIASSAAWKALQEHVADIEKT